MARARFDVLGLRKSLSLSQQKFADKFPVGIRTVQRWESDVDYAAPSPMAIKQMKRMRQEYEASQPTRTAGEGETTPSDTPRGPQKRRASVRDTPREPRETFGGGILPSSL